MKNKSAFCSSCFLCVFSLLILSINVSAQLTESFETGLPTNYSPISSLQLPSGEWLCTPNQIVSNNTWASDGSYSCQLKDVFDSELLSPTFSSGVGAISFSTRTTGSTGSLQVKVSKDNGLTWTAIAGSPFALSSTPTSINVAVNDLFVNKVQFRRTDGTVLIDNVAITACTQTKLKAGDLAILQLNETTTDRFSFITFVTLNVGTEIWFTDNGFESPTTCRTGEGFIKYIAPATIPAGTTISWYSGMNVSGTGWLTVPAPSITITANDQLFAYQGEWTKSYQLISGMSLSNWLVSGTASTTSSYLPTQLTNGVNAFSFPTNKTNAYYIGIKSAIKDILKFNINSSSNWTTSSSDQGSQPMNFTFANSHTISTNTSFQSLNIDAGETVTINPAVQLTVGSFVNNGTLSLLSDATGTASFIPATISGSGNYIVRQYLPAGNRNWYICSPMNLAALPAGTSSFGYMENGSNLDFSTLGATAYWKQYAAGSTMTNGKGYVVPLNAPTAPSSIEFTGIINHTNADATMDIAVSRTETASSKGFNLVGNPYPAYLDWSLVKALETNADLESSLWFRTKNAVGYTFATFNCVGNQAVTNGATTSISNLIPPMQAFWVRVKPNVNNTSYATDMQLNGAMRAHCSDAGNRLKAPKAVQHQLVRLVLSNGEATDETLLYFTPLAADNKDEYDSPKFLNKSVQVPDLYSIVSTENLVINGMNALPLNTEIPLGFATAKKASLSIKATEIVGLPHGMQVLLKDKEVPTLFNLTNGDAFTFDSEAQTSNARFSLIFKSEGLVDGLTKFDDDSSIRVFVTNDGFIQILAHQSDNSAFASVFNASGQLQASLPLQLGSALVAGITTPGVYWVKIANGKRIAVRKVIIH